MFLQNFKNHIDFWLRNKMKISRGNYICKNEPKDNIFDDFPDKKSLIAKEEELFAKYKLEYLKNNSTKINYLENLHRIEFLEKYLTISQDTKSLKILDVGSKNWFYAQGEYNFFKFAYSEKDIELTGIEIDAYRLYTNFYSRYDYAKSYIKGLKDVKYIVGDILKHNEQYDYITIFFPFVLPAPLIHWGLPINHFNPAMQIKHIFSLLKQGGQIIITNQGEKEYLKQREILDLLSIPYKAEGIFKGLFLEYEHDWYVIVIDKK